MCIEEPTACSLISQALNKGNELSLQTTELTALAVLSGAVTAQLESAVAGHVAFETMRDKVRAELDMVVDLPEFIELFEFVISMGAQKSPFIPLLLEFASKFVDQKKRQLRLQSFTEVNNLSDDLPRCKIAILKRATATSSHHA